MQMHDGYLVKVVVKSKTRKKLHFTSKDACDLNFVYHPVFHFYALHAAIVQA